MQMGHDNSGRDGFECVPVPDSTTEPKAPPTDAPPLEAAETQQPKESGGPPSTVAEEVGGVEKRDPVRKPRQGKMKMAHRNSGRRGFRTVPPPSTTDNIDSDDA